VTVEATPAAGGSAKVAVTGRDARLGCRVVPRVRLDLDVFNIANAKVSDVDYFYASRLPGEPAAGVDDVTTTF